MDNQNYLKIYIFLFNQIRPKTINIYGVRENINLESISKQVKDILLTKILVSGTKSQETTSSEPQITMQFAGFKQEN